MKTIWKYQLFYIREDNCVFNIPRGAKVVHVARVHEEGSVLSFWVEFDRADIFQKEQRKFTVFGTGHSIPQLSTYHGTIIDNNLLLHLYELPMGGEDAQV